MISVGYVNFSKDDFGYGLSYVLSKTKLKTYRATVQTTRHFDVLLFSIFWWEHVYKFYEFCINADIGAHKHEKPLIIVGGFNTFNPHVFIPYAHRVVVGDGEGLIEGIIEGKPYANVFTGHERTVEYRVCPIEDNNFVYTSDTGISRIEIARGCKYKCRFCQLAWLKPYREASLESVKSAIDRVTSKLVALFAPNSPSHSSYLEIMDYAKAKGFPNIAADVRYNELEGYDNQQTPTIGLEGLSYRLRKSVGKPVKNEELRDKFFDLFERQMKKGYKPSLHTYIILDLPGEETEDFSSFRELMGMVDDYKYAPLVTWIMTANVFMPAPHTPLEMEQIHLERDYKAIWIDRIVSDRDGRPKHKFQLGGRHTVFSPYSRLLSMIATRGGPDTWRLIEQIAGNKQLKQAMLGPWQRSLKVLTKFIDKNFGGIDQFTGTPSIRHWDIVTLLSQEGASKRPPLDRNRDTLKVPIPRGDVGGKG